MATKNERSSNRGFWMTFLVIAILIILACMAVMVCGIIAYISYSTPTPGAVITSPPTTVESTKPSLTITAWLSIPSEDQAYLNNQIQQFMQANPNIQVQVEYFTETELAEKLSASAKSAGYPEIASLTYNLVATLQASQSISALDLRKITNQNDFLIEAMDTTKFDGMNYGLPWLRNGCAPNYLNLSLFNPSPEKLDASYRFVDYLALTEQQNQNYQDKKWYPTRMSVYEAQHITCETVVVILPDPAAIPAIRQQVSDAAPAIDVRYKISLNLVDVTGVLPESSTPYQQEPSPTPQKAPVGRFMQTASPEPEASAAAVLEQPSDEEIQYDMANGGVFVGALVVNDQPEGFPAQPGQYAVQCKQIEGTENGQCTLLPTDPVLSIVPVPVEPGVKTEDTVSAPAVYVEDGSRIICYRVDGLRFCFRFK